jgi:hypothetical protein
MIQAFSHIFYFFDIASPCGDMLIFFIGRKLCFSTGTWFKKNFF